MHAGGFAECRSAMIDAVVAPGQVRQRSLMCPTLIAVAASTSNEQVELTEPLFPTPVAELESLSAAGALAANALAGCTLAASMAACTLKELVAPPSPRAGPKTRAGTGSEPLGLELSLVLIGARYGKL